MLGGNVGRGSHYTKDPKQSAIAQARVRGRLNRVKKPLDVIFDKRRRFAFGPREPFGLNLPGRVHGQNAFFGQPRKQSLTASGPTSAMIAGNSNDSFCEGPTHALTLEPEPIEGATGRIRNAFVL